MENYSATIARRKLSRLSVTRLCALWAETERLKITQALFDVRGWIMDALSDKDTRAFDLWINNDANSNPAGEDPAYWYN